MPLVLADRVKGTTTTAGTGTVTLSGTAPSGFQSFDAIGNANTTYYALTSGVAWEVGIGTYTASGTTFSRDTVLSSSAAGAKITLSGTSDIFVTYPSGKTVIQDGANILAGSATLPVTNGGTGSTSAATALTALGAYPAANPSGYITASSLSAYLPLTGGTLTGGLNVTSGNVGIGTSSPASKLTINDNGTGQTFTNAGGAEFNIGLLAGTGNKIAYVFQRANADLIFGTNNAERMSISAAGNVGIGTTTPRGKSEIVGSGTSTSVSPPSGTQLLSFAGGSTAGAYGASLNFTQEWWAGASGSLISVGQIVGLKTAGDGNFGGGLAFLVGPSGGGSSTHIEAMRIDGNSGGNVGIGTSSPTARLHLRGTAAGGAIASRIINTDATGFTSVIFGDDADTRGQIWVGNPSYASFGGAGSMNYSANSGPHVWHTNYTERMRIDAAGNVGIGVTSPSVKLAVAGTIESTTGGFKFPDGTTQTSAGGAVSYPQNIQSANYTLTLADAGKHIYSANTGAQTITIPTNASVAFPIGSVVTIVNMGTASTSLSIAGVSVFTNGSITSLTNPVIASGAAVQLLKTGTNAWKSTFGVMVNDTLSITFLAAAGGGGGGSASAYVTGPAGGGAGGLLTGALSLDKGAVYTVTVGAGGSGGASASPSNGLIGSTSSFSTRSTTGGGGGGGGGSSGATGGAGGSGGGGTNTGGVGGARIAGQGNIGGAAISGNITGAGGGGAGAVGGNTSGTSGGAGGNGLASSITGSSVTYAGGGGGSGDTGGAGGAGGGGAGVGFTGNGTAGTANRGGGGGGAGWTSNGNGGNGGSGVIIISSPLAAASTTGSPTVTTSGGNTIYQFNSSGTITF